MDRLIFHNPNKQVGLIDIATTQLNKQINFSFSQAVNSNCKISVSDTKNTIKSYTVGDGLTLSNSDNDVKLVLNGSDFINYDGKILDVLCSFFNIGDIEMQFNLKIIPSKL